jgi:hypothetical protein
MNNTQIENTNNTGLLRNVILIGGPRSGTSLTASIFASRGFHIGSISDRRLRMGDINNPFGYFEADDLIEANVNILKRAGYDCHNTWLFDAVSQKVCAAIDELKPSSQDLDLIEKYNTYKPWAWKDPRLCFTFSYWARLLDMDEINIVFIRRDAREMFHSLVRSGWTSKERFYREDRCNALALHEINALRIFNKFNLSYVKIDFDEYFRDIDSVAMRLKEFTGVDICSDDINVQKNLNHNNLTGKIKANLRLLARTGRLGRAIRAMKWK